MSIKARRFHYHGNKWVLFVWAVVLFPVAIVLFLLDAVWVEQDITPEQLEQLESAK